MSVSHVHAHKASVRKAKSAQQALTQARRLEDEREAREATENLAALKRDYLRRHPERAA